MEMFPGSDCGSHRHRCGFKVEKKMKLQWRARSRSPASSSGSKICSGAAQRCWRMSMSGMAKLYPGSVFDGCGKSGGCGSYAARDGDRRRDDGALVTAAWGCIALAADKIVKRESGVTPAVR